MRQNFDATRQPIRRPLGVRFLSIFLIAQCSLFALQIQSQSSNAINLLAQFRDVPTEFGDVWGYVDAKSGKEYALVSGRSSGLVIIDVSIPTNPVKVGAVSTVPGFDVKAWQHYVYTVNGGSSGQGGIVDISDPANPEVVGHFPSSHNIFIAENGYMYLEVRGVRIFDLKPDPTNPQLVWSGGVEGHDASVIENTLFDFHGSFGTNIYDVTDPLSPRLLSSIQSPLIEYNHSGWTSRNGRFLFICDELNEFRSSPIADITVWDISDIQNPQLVGLLTDSTATVHNLYAIGDYAFVSYYSSGFKVLDISDPANPVILETFDTSPESGPGFNGAYGVYPYSPSGTIYVNSSEGLFLFEFTGGQSGVLSGTITSKGSGVLVDAAIRPLRTLSTTKTDENGQYDLRLPAGEYMMKASASGHYSVEEPVTIPPHGAVSLDVELEPLETGRLTGSVKDANSGESIASTVTLFASNQAVGKVRTAEDGSYLFDHLFITSPGIRYNRLTVVPDFDYPVISIEQEVVINASATTTQDIVVRPANLTMVDDDNGAGYESEYQASIAALGLTAFRWNVASRGAIGDSILLLTSPTVIYFTGDSSANAPLSPEKATSLIEFLDHGGRLLLTGQNIVEALDPSHELIRSFLQVAYVGTATDFLINGVGGDPISDGMLLQLRGTTDNQTSMEVLQPFGNAIPIFNYGAIGQNGVAGVRVEGSGWKVVYLGFGFEAVNNLNNNSRLTYPADLLNSILTWFETPSSIAETFQVIPGTPALAQNYPNPFNPTTTIHYQLSKATHVTLKVFDLLGKEVATLAEGAQEAGSHEMVFEAKNLAGGIYVYQLQTNEFVQKRKCVLLK